jgi:transcriptional regulator
MYIPKSFSVTDRETLFEFLDTHDFANLIMPREQAVPDMTQLPLLLHRDGEHAWLWGHLSRANEIWRRFDGKETATCVFQGPHAYISPRWYGSRMSVPTWNYATVQAWGKPEVRDTGEDVDWLMRTLVERYERGVDRWRIAELPAEVYQRHKDAIVVFRLKVEGIEGKFKLSQNRLPVDREGVVRGLEKRGQAHDNALVRLMKHLMNEI